MLANVTEKISGLARRVLRGGSSASVSVIDEALRSVRAGLYMGSHFIDGELLPGLAFLSEMARDVETSWLATLDGKKGFGEHLTELAERTLAASKYDRLVHGPGKELFGSARFPGEQVLADDGIYRLSYLPPKAGAARQAATLFHLGGFIPYGDRIFRFLPEANLYDRFLERGIGVYAMEQRGDRHEMRDMGSLTLTRFIDQTDEMLSTAFEHGGRRKLVACGYCGTGMQLLSYIAALPRAAEAKLDTAVLFVSPVDGRRCRILGEMVNNMPRALFLSEFARSRLLGGYLNGVEMWAGLDLSLKNVFMKTSLGRFASGWKNRTLAGVNQLGELSPPQRFELAGAYWISVDNADRFPIPVDLVRQSVEYYDKGIEPDGDTHVDYRGQRINLHAIARETTLRFTGIYGGQDNLVQDSTAHPLKKILGDRYRHVVNPNAAHVSYICMPAQWLPGHAASFTPNPIDLVLEQHAAKQVQHGARVQAQA